MAGISGVRGIVGEGLDSGVASDYASAYATMCGEGPILLARDPRISGEMLREAVVETLTGAGRTVVDLGVVPTPTLLLNTALLKAAGGIMITASHNPIEWNGLKFADPSGRYLAPEASKQRIAEVGRRDGQRAGAGRSGQLREDVGAAGRHMELAARARGVDTDAIAGAGLKVVVDGGGGAASWIVPSFLEGCGVQVHTLHCDPDGTFPRPPEPLPDALTDLGRAVEETGSDLGLALDPDGDRLALVGRDGAPLGEEVTLALAARQVLTAAPGPVVTNLSTSRMLDDVAKEAHTRLFRTPVGEINVAEGMLAEDAVVGGEGNGGVIHRDVVMGRDGLTAAALILSALAGSGNDLPGLRSAIPGYAMLKSRYALPDDGVEGLGRRLQELPSAYPGARADDRDGLRLDWEDRWVHIRPSNTEPIVRLISEAPTAEGALELAEGAADRMDLRSE
jgi:phosphomannomutase